MVPNLYAIMARSENGLGNYVALQNGKSSLRCDIREMAAPSPRPADCKLEWGHSFEMEAEGTAARTCTDDTTFDPGLEDLLAAERK